MNITLHLQQLDNLIQIRTSPPVTSELRNELHLMTEQIESYQASSDKQDATLATQAETIAELQKANQSLKTYGTEDPLSTNAKRLLFEIELSDVSHPKGLSILHLTGEPTRGDYLPHLYNANHPSRIRNGDLDALIQAAEELVSANWLVHHSSDGNVIQYRRTSRSIPL